MSGQSLLVASICAGVQCNPGFPWGKTQDCVLSETRDLTILVNGSAFGSPAKWQDRKKTEMLAYGEYLWSTQVLISPVPSTAVQQASGMGKGRNEGCTGCRALLEHPSCTGEVKSWSRKSRVRQDSTEHWNRVGRKDCWSLKLTDPHQGGPLQKLSPQNFWDICPRHVSMDFSTFSHLRFKMQ